MEISGITEKELNTIVLNQEKAELSKAESKEGGEITPPQEAAGTQDEAAEEKANEELLQAGVDKFNQVVELFNKELKFMVHKGTERMMVEVLNRETDEVIKEIPPKEFLDWLAKFHSLLGIMVDTTV